MKTYQAFPVRAYIESFSFPSNSTSSVKAALISLRFDRDIERNKDYGFLSSTQLGLRMLEKETRICVYIGLGLKLSSVTLRHLIFILLLIIINILGWLKKKICSTQDIDRY